jgi:hypothetical protein
MRFKNQWGPIVQAMPLERSSGLGIREGIAITFQVPDGVFTKVAIGAVPGRKYQHCTLIVPKRENGAQRECLYAAWILVGREGLEPSTKGL